MGDLEACLGHLVEKKKKNPAKSICSTKITKIPLNVTNALTAANEKAFPTKLMHVKSLLTNEY